jgi:hypothetical protein
MMLTLAFVVGVLFGIYAADLPPPRPPGFS